MITFQYIGGCCYQNLVFIYAKCNVPNYTITELDHEYLQSIDIRFTCTCINIQQLCSHAYRDASTISSPWFNL